MKKNVLIIGGSKGIGLESVKLLHKNANVFVASRSSDHLKELNVTLFKI